MIHLENARVLVTGGAIDVRPPDYSTSFARQASQLSGLERPISVCTIERPDWLRGLVDVQGVEVCELEDALASYAARTPEPRR